MLVNYRPEYRHDGALHAYTQLRLDPLGTESAAEMPAALAIQGLQKPKQGIPPTDAADGTRRRTFTES
jgi:hypothetical protein